MFRTIPLTLQSCFQSFILSPFSSLAHVTILFVLNNNSFHSCCAYFSFRPERQKPISCKIKNDNPFFSTYKSDTNPDCLTMSDHHNSETSEEVTKTGETARLLVKTAESFQQATATFEDNLSKPLRCSEKPELWLRAGFNETARPSSEEGKVLQQGWLAPYIEQGVGEDSEEKVELWIRAHFSHPVSDCFHDGKGFSKQQSENEKAKATESLIRSLAAL